MKKLLAAGSVVAAAAALAVPAFAATKTVQVDDDVFKPKSLSIGKGDTVRFRWVGKAPHNVARASGPRFSRIGTRSKGTVSRKFSKAGTYGLVCTIHPGMNLKIRVR